MTANPRPAPAPKGWAALRAFVIHLRVHYQLLILSGGYLLGGLYTQKMDWETFLVQFLVVHILLNGGVTAYNSYWDDDDGPIGGVEHPPKMAPWMQPASLALQLGGLAISWRLGAATIALYTTTMLLSVLYSRRPPRWKGRPILSLVCVGVGTGTHTFLMGALAAGRPGLDPELIIAAVGVALLLTSLYPVSQVFQIEEDAAHGDRTFAVAFGLAGVRRFFWIMYPLGLMTTAFTLGRAQGAIGLVFGVVGAAGGALSALQLQRLDGQANGYRAVMRLKYGASLSFVVFLTATLLWIHRPIL